MSFLIDFLLSIFRAHGPHRRPPDSNLTGEAQARRNSDVC